MQVHLTLHTWGDVGNGLEEEDSKENNPSIWSPVLERADWLTHLHSDPRFPQQDGPSGQNPSPGCYLKSEVLCSFKFQDSNPKI
jgi:hypothetical protein